MSLFELIHGRFVLFGLKAASKNDAIVELIDYLVKTSGIPGPARDSVVHAVIERENQLPTGVEAGVALPHGVTDAVESEVVAIGISHEGVPFDAADNLPANIIILHVAPPRDAASRVRTLSRIAQIISCPETRMNVLECGGPGEVVETLREAEECL